MQDPRYKQAMDGDMVTGVDMGREPSTNRVAVIAGGKRPRLGALIAGLAAGLFAAAAPTQPLIIVSRRHPDDDVLDGVVYNAPDVVGNSTRLGEVMVIDDPWSAAMEAEQRRLSSLSFDDMLARTLGNPGMGLLGMLAPGAKRRPSCRAHGLNLAHRARLADGACTYRPTGSKRTHRRAMGKAYERMRRDFYRTLSNEGF